MATKNNCSCLAKAAEDEPIFVFRAQDRLAPSFIRLWAQSAKLGGMSQAKYDEAIACCEAMEAWPTRKMPD